MDGDGSIGDGLRIDAGLLIGEGGVDAAGESVPLPTARVSPDEDVVMGGKGGTRPTLD